MIPKRFRYQRTLNSVVRNRWYLKKYNLNIYRYDNNGGTSREKTN